METISEKNLVSVIIPTYNSGKYICEALDSVFSQTYKYFEVIVIDDGSTDDTKELLRPYYDRITYIFQENKGLANTRNKGIKTAKGEYISFLDADDIWLRNKLKLQLKCFEIFPEVGIVFSDFSSFNAEGIIALSWIKGYFDSIFRTYNLNFDTIFKQKYKLDNHCIIYTGNICSTMFLGNIALPSTVLIKRRCIDKVGMLTEKYKQNADYDLFLRITSGYKGGYINIPLIKYRLWEKSLSKRSKNEMIGVLEVMDIIENFIKENPIFAKKRIRRVKQRFSELFYELGYAYFSKNNLNDAKRNFIKSVKYCSLSQARLKIYLYFIASILSPRIIVLLKYWKNKLKAFIHQKG